MATSSSSSIDDGPRCAFCSGIGITDAIVVMSNADEQSPEDLAAMRKVLVAMAEEKGAESVITMLVDVLGQARAQNTQLQVRVQQLLRQLYGRKSEKVSAAQLSLLLQGLGEHAPTTAQLQRHDPQLGTIGRVALRSVPSGYQLAGKTCSPSAFPRIGRTQ